MIAGSNHTIKEPIKSHAVHVPFPFVERNSSYSYEVSYYYQKLSQLSIYITVTNIWVRTTGVSWWLSKQVYFSIPWWLNCCLRIQFHPGRDIIPFSEKIIEKQNTTLLVSSNIPWYWYQLKKPFGQTSYYTKGFFFWHDHLQHLLSVYLPKALKPLHKLEQANCGATVSQMLKTME